MSDARELPEASLPALRRLARGLLYDRERAEDAVQEAWLAALRKNAPAVGLFGWLATATRRAAQNARREDGRRRAREERVARVEAQPSAAEVSGQIELLQRLLAALDALAEPYRSAVALRYLDDLPPRAIARQLGLPVNTVRTHVRRGLAELRRTLDGDGRGREELLAVLVPLARAPLGSLAGGGLGMLVGKKVAVALAALVALGSAWFWLREPERAGHAGVLASAAGTEMELAEPPSAPATPGVPTETSRSATTVEASPVTRSAVVVRERTSGKALAGARVSLVDRRGAPQELAADAQGALEVESALLCESRIEVHAEGCFPSVVRPGLVAAGERVVVELDLAGELRVRVLEEDGRPVPRAFVLVEAERGADGREPFELWPELCYLGDSWSADPLAQLSVTDAEGEVVLRGFPCDRPLRVGAHVVVPATTVAALIPSTTRSQEVEIRVTRHGCIRGRLLWKDGSPAVDGMATAFARALLDDESGSRGGSTAPDGSFELCGLPLGWVRWCVERAGGLSQNRFLERVDRLDGPALDVGEIRLARPCAVEGRVVVRGAPPGADAPLFLSFQRDGAVVGACTLRPEGVFTAFVPAGELTLSVLSGLDVLLQRRVRVPCEPLSLDLDPFIASLEVRHPPVAMGSRFQLCFQEAGTSTREHARTFAHDPEQSRGRELLWNESGFRVSFLRTGTFDVYLDLQERGVRSLGRATLLAGTTATLECGESEPASVSGRLLTPAGAPLAGARLAAAMDWMRGDSPVERVTDADGRFAFADLAAGRWRIYPRSLGPESDAVRFVELAPGQRVELALVSGAPGSLSGSVRHDGAGLGDVAVYLRPSEVRTKTDASGAYRFDGLFPGSYSVLASAAAPNDEFDRVETLVTVEAGAAAVVDFDLDAQRQTVVVRRHGQPFHELTGAWACSPRGAVGARSVPGRDDALSMTLDGGPWLLLLCSARAPWVEGARGDQLFHAVYLPAVPATDELELDIDGGSLVVDATGSDEPLPLLTLTGLGAVPSPRWAGEAPRLIFEDFAPGRRRFVDLPPGARVRLESRRGLARGPALELELGGGGEVVVPWPPR